MDSSSKNKVNGVPFQIITRNRSQILTLEKPREVKVVLKKLSSTLPSTSIIKSNMQAGPVEQMNASPVRRKRSLSPKSENLGQLSNLSVRSSDIEVIDLSNSPLPSETGISSLCIKPLSDTKRKTKKIVPAAKPQVRKSKEPVSGSINKKAPVSINSSLPTETGTSSLCIRSSLSDKRRKAKNVVPAAKTKGRKSKQTVSGTINKKGCKVSSVKVTARKPIKDQLKSKKTSQSTSAKAHKGSKNCSECLVKEDNINLLQSKIRKFEEKEASMQNRISIYEGLGLSHLKKEEENKTSLKKKRILQMKLSKLEEELQTFLEREDEEIKSLLHKKITLKRDLTEKRKESKKLDAEEELELKGLREKTEKCKEMEAKCQIELVPLQEELSAIYEEVRGNPILRYNLWHEKEIREKREQEEQNEKKQQEPCEICIKLINEKKTVKKKVQRSRNRTPSSKKGTRRISSAKIG